MKKQSAAFGDQEPQLDHEEILAAVANAFCTGIPPAMISKLIRKQHGVRLTREAPYKYLKQAAAKGRLKYEAPNENNLTKRLSEDYAWLKSVDVVHTSMLPDLAVRTAEVIVDLLRESRRVDKREVHIGMSGGNSMRLVALNLANLLCQQSDDLPERIVFHAVVAGFDVFQPFTDPNAFFTYFQHPLLEGRIGYVGLHAPALVERGRMTEMFQWPGIREARAAVSDIDILVTSAGSRSDPHGMVRKYYDANPMLKETSKRLTSEGCIGDMMWLPISRTGPIDCDEHQFRSMSVLELSELPERFLNRGKQVVLALGPCSICSQRKTQVLSAILDLASPLISHLIVDSVTIRDLYGELEHQAKEAQPSSQG